MSLPAPLQSPPTAAFASIAELRGIESWLLSQDQSDADIQTNLALVRSAIMGMVPQLTTSASNQLSYQTTERDDAHFASTFLRASVVLTFVGSLVVVPIMIASPTLVIIGAFSALTTGLLGSTALLLRREAPKAK